MTCYVYILYSKRINKYYVGHTVDKRVRVLAHNHHFFKNAYTVRSSDWKLFLAITCTTKTQAIKIEKHIKSMKSRRYNQNLKQYSQFEPTFEYCFIHGRQYNEKELNKIREKNSKTMEIFADSYANKYGYGKELISTFHKQDKYFEQKIRYSTIRIETILKEEYLEGHIMSPNKSAGNTR